MKANELRIGNYVIPLIDGYELEARPIKASEFYMIDNNPKSIRPVPLTEEWLLKFGFELEVNKGNQNEFRVYSLNNITYNTNHGWWWKHYLEFQPKYVHQLQNLYFALAGDELTLKTNQS